MSKIEVNTIDAQCGSTITLGSSGKTVTLAPGASQSGFGRTGTVDWCTTAKTSPFTSVSGKGYFVNTTGGVVTVTLPASPSGGDIVAIKDYAKTFDTNNVTIGRNSSKIGGSCLDATLSTEGISTTLVYVDGTQGWLVVNDGKQSEASTAQFIAASGGTETTCGDYKIHTFNSDANFVVSSAGNSEGSNTVSYIVVAGGAGAGGDTGGGGGAGGFREGLGSNDSYTGSPLRNPTGVPVSASTYPITVGAGGSASPSGNAAPGGGNGSNSIFSTITSAGGGAGAGGASPHKGNDGGSGGGNRETVSPDVGGAGNTPPVSPPQGNPGGTYHDPSGQRGGGGGAIEAGNTDGNGFGGDGATTEINGSSASFAGGGGAAGTPTVGTGGTGGGANGNPSGTGSAGTTNTGGGGSGGNNDAAGGAGGSGVVVIRYKFQ